MKKIKETFEIVKRILEVDELARKDDCYLMLKVLEITHPDEIGKTFANVMLNAKRNTIRFESITRARRKVQEKFPHLKDSETSKSRDEEQQNYRKEYGGNNE